MTATLPGPSGPHGEFHGSFQQPAWAQCRELRPFADFLTPFSMSHPIFPYLQDFT